MQILLLDATLLKYMLECFSCTYNEKKYKNKNIKHIKHINFYIRDEIIVVLVKIVQRGWNKKLSLH